ncbi:MAG: threonine--tRNA ligase [Candidatus Giovannonibacteria bacterium]|nr:MAG: threonine--tRNA ligase [Candidatus Giovannonibacteria bacterium]
MPESKKHRDHRDLGREMDLFSFHEIAPGAPFWHPKGMIIVKELEKYIRKLQDDHNYAEISTPIMVKKKLFEQSGHWEFFKENMFYFDVENETYSLKPMNCPESALVYQTKIRSYRDLPMRLAEIGRLHRNELSGVLGGLLRVRQMTMDDAHIYCRFDQIKEELVSVLKMTEEFYKRLGLKVNYGLATRPEKAMGSQETWNEAEKILREALSELGLKYNILKGEGAFYGPKIHFDIKDSQGRVWTIATAQLDFQLPERFELEYTDENGKSQRPVIIHRAIFGSFERFIGILLEHFDGALPFWLSPTQVAVLTINDKVSDYAEKFYRELKEKNIRAELDSRNETIAKKIRDAETQRIPYLLVIGEKEMKENKVAVRERGKGNLGEKTLDEFLKMVK